jgi:hypothetical protein
MHMTLKKILFTFIVLINAYVAGASYYPDSVDRPGTPRPPQAQSVPQKKSKKASLQKTSPQSKEQHACTTTQCPKSRVFLGDLTQTTHSKENAQDQVPVFKYKVDETLKTKDNKDFFDLVIKFCQKIINSLNEIKGDNIETDESFKNINQASSDADKIDRLFKHNTQLQKYVEQELELKNKELNNIRAQLDSVYIHVVGLIEELKRWKSLSVRDVAITKDSKDDIQASSLDLKNQWEKIHNILFAHKLIQFKPQK